MVDEESPAEYRKRVQPNLDSYVQNSRDSAVEFHLEILYWFYCFLTEDFEVKIVKNKELCRSFFPLMVEVQDLTRGISTCQRNNLLATASISLRTIFEIYVNSKFIFESQDPPKYLQRLADFAVCEELLGQKYSPALPSPSEEVERTFANLHPYWAKEGKIKDSPNWNGEGKSLKSICVDLKIDEFYYRIYKPTSKFAHGSPVVKNLYKRGDSMGSIADRPHTTRMCLLAGDFVHRFIEETCGFFGVALPKEAQDIKTEYESLASR